MKELRSLISEEGQAIDSYKAGTAALLGLGVFLGAVGPGRRLRDICRQCQALAWIGHNASDALLDNGRSGLGLSLMLFAAAARRERRRDRDREARLHTSLKWSLPIWSNARMKKRAHKVCAHSLYPQIVKASSARTLSYSSQHAPSRLETTLMISHPSSPGMFQPFSNG